MIIEEVVSPYIKDIVRKNDYMMELVKDMGIPAEKVDLFLEDYYKYLFHPLSLDCTQYKCEYLKSFLEWIREYTKIMQLFLKLNIEFKRILKIQLASDVYEFLDSEIETKTSYLFNYYLYLVEQYKQVFFSSGLFSRTDQQGTINFVNDRFCEVSEYTKDELLGQPHNIIRHPDTPSSLFKDLWSTIKSKKAWIGDIKNKKKNGGSYWVRSFVAPILDPVGNISEFISVRVDITELKKTLKKAEEYKKSLDETSMVLYLDKHGNIIEANDNFLQNFVCNDCILLSQKLINLEKKCFESLHMFVDDKGEQLNSSDVVLGILEKITHPVIDGVILKLRTNKNKIVWCSMSSIMLSNIEGIGEGYIVIFKDITYIEEAKLQAEQNLETLKELDKKKDNFINVASHELRTPITLINGYTELLLADYDSELTENIRAPLQVIQKSAKHLTHMLSDMLDLARLESEDSRVNFDKFDLIALLKDLEKDFKATIQDKSIQFNLELKESDLIVHTDYRKLRQMLFNLVHNAFKFTPKGGEISIIVEVESETIKIDVKDNGIGIEEKDFALIFDKFGQVKSDLSRELEGTGLGLNIVKEIISQLKGTIEVKSKINEGSEFIVTLPK